jgi:hypothetical protein
VSYRTVSYRTYCTLRAYARLVLFDAFIGRASEEMSDFARPLADQLRGPHVVVWYDEFSVSVGDSLRRVQDVERRYVERYPRSW